MFFPHYKSMGVIDPQGVASSDSRGSMLWSTRCCHILKIYGFREDFNVSPKISLWKLLIHRMWPVLTQGA